ncbi:fibronectin type III domain-containing protein (plasmid) [Microtetraspora malaysiensis]|uniref:fibronectin type III domain-containing protein n=1 Tax=Microtetraspora malaysiensis TaxID=161358 RepID=UPI003D8E56C2
MGQIQTKTYKKSDTDPTSMSHQILFGSAGARNRLIIEVTSFQTVNSWSSGWTLVTYTESDGHFTGIFTRVATGGESSFSVVLADSSRVCHMWMVERDDVPEVITSWSGAGGGSRTFSLAKDGYIVGAYHRGGEGAEYASWPISMSVAHRAVNVSSSSYTFASDFGHRNLTAGAYTVNTGGMQSSSGWTYSFAVFGRDQTPPTSPGGLSVSNRTSDGCKLTWSASSDNVGVTRYGLYVNGAWVADTTNLSYEFTGLSAGVALSLGVAAFDAQGNRSSISTISVTLDGTAPTMPGRLRLIAMTTTSLTVSWQPSTDNVGVAGYGVYLDGLKVGDQTTLTRAFNGLVTDQQYVIEVDAYDTSGNRSVRAVLRATPKIDTTPPDPPKIWVTALAAGMIAVRWDEPADDSAVSSYSVYRGGVKVSDQVEQEYVFTGLTPGGLYVIGVEAIDLSGNRSVRATRSIRAQADTTPPTVPANLRLVAATQTSVTVTWDASTDDNAGVGFYRVYLGNTPLANIESQVFTITGLSPGIGYRVQVDAADQVGNRSAKALLAVTTKEDKSGAAPPYEYTVIDHATHEPIDTLPLQGVTFTLAMRAGSKVTASIPLYDVAYTAGRVEAATQSDRTMLAIYRGDRFVAGGRVAEPEDYESTSGVQSITADDPVAIYQRRFVRFTGPRLDTYADTEIEWLMQHTAAAADKRWLRFAGAPGLLPVDRDYRQDEFQRILDAVNGVADGAGGFDYWVKPVWDPINDRPMFELRRVSRDNPPDTGLVLEYPGNVQRYKRSKQRALETTTYGKLSIPDGGVVLSKVVKQPLLDAGWPLVEEAYSFDGLTSKEALDAETARAAEAAAGPKLLYEFTIKPGAGVKWWDLEIGGLAQVVISDWKHPEKPDGSPGLDRPMKIVQIAVTPQTDQGEQVVITCGEFTLAVS